MSFGLVYTQGGGDEKLTGYSDSDLAGDLVTRIEALVGVGWHSI